MTNPTMQKFGHPDTVIGETARWVVQLRPEQPTLGALVLLAKEEAGAFADLSPAAFADLGEAVGRIERMLEAEIGHEKINYLMLMMVDPDVHFHVLPRYEGEKTLDGIAVRDAGWPGPPALAEATTPPPAAREALIARMRASWAR